MKTIHDHHLTLDSLKDHQERLVMLIEELIKPDFIFLLGSSLNKKTSNSFFSFSDHETLERSDYFFLILVSNTQNKILTQLQDQIEQHCNSISATTAIVLETKTFNHWLSLGHPFASNVCQSVTPIYQVENILLSAVGEYDLENERKLFEKQYLDGLLKVQEFLAGADLFTIRKQYKLALFMLHQATEQALSTIAKTGTGYYCCTHNIDRLFRYASLVNCQICKVFPRNTEDEKGLFTLLQNAYIDSRYKEGFTVKYQDLFTLTERVRLLLSILQDWRKKLRSIHLPSATVH